mmetsp:Transcript_130956/g.184531  ORF Transcript_130956/g.184531 Transcript_130956/m.184531 type:complete len:193 (-) Transcript_130956:57-635(-)
MGPKPGHRGPHAHHHGKHPKGDEQLFHGKLGDFSYDFSKGRIGGSVDVGKGWDVGGHVDYGSKWGGGVDAKLDGQGGGASFDKDANGWTADANGHYGAFGGHATVQNENGHYNGDIGASVGASFGGVEGNAGVTEKFNSNGWAGQHVGAGVSGYGGEFSVGANEGGDGEWSAPSYGGNFGGQSFGGSWEEDE